MFPSSSSSFLTGGTGRFFARVPRSAVVPLKTSNEQANVVTAPQASPLQLPPAIALELEKLAVFKSALQRDLFDNASRDNLTVNSPNVVDESSVAEGGAR